MRCGVSGGRTAGSYSRPDCLEAKAAGRREHSRRCAIADEDIIICRCEEITKKDILDAIEDGCVSVVWVKRKTRAGMGLCQGRTCGHLVARLLAQETEADPAEVLPDTRRPPVRPIPLEILEEAGENEP